MSSYKSVRQPSYSADGLVEQRNHLKVEVEEQWNEGQVQTTELIDMCDDV